jgi:hypothetical protein
MAIFDKEKEFYRRPAALVKADQLLLSQVVDFVASHVFMVTVPISIATYALAAAATMRAAILCFAVSSADSSAW